MKIFLMKSQCICMWSHKDIKFSLSRYLFFLLLFSLNGRQRVVEWNFLTLCDDSVLPRWHARWRSREVCILLKYFHSLKYFSGVENISPWQSWYKSLCYLCPTVRDIGCWYICCFSFQSPHWFVCLLRIIETKYLWKTEEEGRAGNYLAWQQIRLSLRKRGNDVSCGSNYLLHIIYSASIIDISRTLTSFFDLITKIQMQEI